MASGDIQVQSAVYALEQGKWAIAIKTAMFALLIVVLTLVYLFIQFAGLSSPTAMNQAQIARNLAMGKGFTTDNISPLAIDTLRKAGKLGEQADLSRVPDIYESPLNPWITSIPLRLIINHLGKPSSSATSRVYFGDRVVVCISILFFLLSVGVMYFVGAQLFDSKLALYGCAIALLTDLLWQFSLSALPQMLALFLFSLAMLATLFAMRAQEREQAGITVVYLIAAGLLFGLMTLAHGLAVWIFVGWLLFTAIYFRPRGLMAAAALAAFALVVTPWLVRNYQVSGSPLGLAFQGIYYDDSPDSGYLRSYDGGEAGKDVRLMGKLRRNVIAQGENLFGLLGMNLAAMIFFVSLIHPFRNKRTSFFRWCLLLMWIGAVTGMSLYYTPGSVSTNQLHPLFIPLFVFYGLAFLFILWNRLEIGTGILRIVFIGAIIVICAAPLLMTRVGWPADRFQWPPYAPPVIGYLNDWFKEDEIIASDMPWAIAWYAQRKSLLLPKTMDNLSQIHDYGEFRQPLCGVFLTPLTGNGRLFTDIYSGNDAAWGPLLMRPPITRGFPFTSFTPLPIGNQCLIFADSPRWLKSREN